MINTELSFEEVCAQIHYMKANPEHLLAHVSYYFKDWFECLTHAINYIDYRVNAEEGAEVDPFDNVELSVLKLGFIILPGIAYMEDNAVSYKIYDAICLLIYNFAQILEDNELMEIFNANILLSKQRDSLENLINVAQSVMIQYQAMNVAGKSSDPYQLSLKYLQALTKEDDDDE